MTMDTTDFQERTVKCSKGIFNLFENGGSGRKLKHRQSEILFLEWVRIITGNSRWHNCGGFAEGSEMKDSDRDTTVVIPNMVVLVNNSDEIEDKTGKIVFEMCPEGHRPCYTELRLVSSGMEEVNLVASKKCNLKELLETQNDGSKYISSKHLVDKVLEMMHNIPLQDTVSVYVNGPCGAYKFKAGDFGTGFEDNVYAIRGSSWPQNAGEWLKRKRKFQWPSDEVIKEISELGCLFVPLGDINSKNPQREWRMSFVLAERLLIWNLNETQFYCYLILKLFLRMNKQLTSTILDSFMMKTVLFWVAEETQISFWKAENLVPCTEACMKKLLYFLKKKELPHYFVRDNNLLSGRTSDDYKIQTIEAKIQSIIANLPTYFHEDIVGIKCTGSECIICNGISLSEMHNIDVLDGWLTRYCIQLPVYANTLHLFELQLSSMSISDLDTIQKNFENIPKSTGILEEHIQLAFRVIYSRLGLGLYKHYLTSEKLNEAYPDLDLLNEVEQLLIFGMEKDAMTGKLQLATFYIMLGRYKDADKIINSIFEEKKVLYNGLPMKEGLYKFAGMSKERPKTTTTLNELIESSSFEIATDIYFYILDWLCLPDALAYECLCLLANFESEKFISHLIAVSPMVYMYFLSVLIYLHFQRADIMQVILNLKARVELEKGTEMYQIGLNLLGYSYGLTGQYDNAIYNFKTSYKERPTKQNPCLLYTLMIIHKHLTAVNK